MAESGLERLGGRLMLLWGWRRLLVAFLAGAVAVLGQAPYDFPAALFVSFPVLVWLLDGAVVHGPGSALRRLSPFFAVGWWWGFGYFLFGLWWVGGALLIEAESFAWALPFVVAGLPALLALFFGLAAVLARPFWTDGIGRVFALAFGFGLAEWLRGWALSGFPWNPVGFAAMPVPLLMQSAHLVGTTGMNALAVFVFAAPALLAGRRHARVGIALAVLLAAAHVGYGWWRLEGSQPAADAPARTLSVRVVQPAIDLAEKWDGAVRDRVLATTIALSRGPAAAGEKAPEVVVWPETAVPFLLTERPDALAAMASVVGDGQILLAGAVRAEGEEADGRFYNSVVAVDGSGSIVDAVDKIHLVPFGEYIPFAELFARVGFRQLVAGPMNFEAGASRRVLALPGGLRAVPFICYEIIFPAEVERDAEGADLLLNVTNDAWFGDTAGPYQHFRHVQVRAAETGLPALRAANNGISAVVDNRGRVLDALAMNVRGRIDASVAVPERPEPPAVSPSRAGVGIILLMGVLALALAVPSRLHAS